MPVVEDPNPETPQVLGTTQARQGRRGRHAMWILVISMSLIGVIYAVMVIGAQPTRLSEPGGQTAASPSALREAGGFNAPAQAARQTEQSPTVSPSVAPSAGKEQPPNAQ